MEAMLKHAQDVLRMEAEAILELVPRVDENFAAAVKLILDCQGRTVITGMGKSGLIGRKMAATLASTGTPSFYLHPAEGIHGDLGMVTESDVVIALSNSGETGEVLNILPSLRRIGAKIIAMVGKPDSTLGKNADVVLNVGVSKEACPLGLAPTSSTTAALAYGDALALALLKKHNFTASQFAIFHPGGSLGRRLLTRVRDVMRKDIPCVEPTATLGDVIIRISDARLGIAAIVEQGRLTGVITDGDVRRAMTKYKENFFNIEARQIMSRSPKTVSPDARITEAEEMMRTHKIHSIVVTDESGGPVGVVEFFNVSVLG